MKPHSPYDVVLIVADTYRKDNAERAARIGSGSAFFRKLEPFHFFDKCFTSAPWTLPACASILSGIDSSQHGYFFHNRPLGRNTLGHYLAGDFHRAAVVNNRNLEPFTGLPDDFDEYHHHSEHEEPFDQARRILARRSPREPLFLLFHTNIPHDYYQQVSRDYYGELCPEPSEWFPLGPRVTNWAGLSPRERSTVRCIYDASTHHMEGRLAAFLDQIDIGDSIVCFVADHGEGFEYERGRIHHGGRLHDDLLRVPLLIRLPEGADREHHDRLAAARGEACSTSDILPTLLELAGCPVPSQIDGQSLLGSAARRKLRNLTAEDRRYLYRPNCERLNVNRRGRNTSLRQRLGNLFQQTAVFRRFDLKGFIRYPYKLIVTCFARPSNRALRSLGSPWIEKLFFSPDPLIPFDALVLSLELFDLESDPSESRNLLSGASPGTVRDRVGDRLGSPNEMQLEIGDRELDLETALRHLDRYA